MMTVENMHFGVEFSWGGGVGTAHVPVESKVYYAAADVPAM